MTRRRAARSAEEVFPGFQQRLVTFVDKEKGDEPFLELLAADALDVARTVRPETVAPNTTLMAWLGVGVASLAVLLWLDRREARFPRVRRQSALDRLAWRRGAVGRACRSARETPPCGVTPTS